MSQTDTAATGITVRDLYELIIRVICFGYILIFVINLPFVMMNLLSHAIQAQEFSAELRLYTAHAGSILSQFSYIVVAIVLFLLAPKIAPLLERNPQRLAPVINQWSPVFVVEIMLLSVGILYLVSSFSQFVPWLVRPNPPDILESQRTVALITSGIIGVLALALIYFRPPLARLVTGPLRFKAATADQSDAPPSDGQ